MKHYCNRRTPQKTDKALKAEREENMSNYQKLDKSTENDIEFAADDDEVVLPPGCDGSMLRELGKRVVTYEGAAEYKPKDGMGGLITQCAGADDTEACYRAYKNMPKAIYADNLSGCFDVMSVHTSDTMHSMADYLQKYKGKFLCIDLWTSDMRRTEKCGVLLETGKDFAVIQTEHHGEIMMIDLKSIRYISIYCR